MYRFLLVSINIESILEEVTIGRRRRKLEEMSRGNGLSDAYTATLARLKGQKRNKAAIGLKVLMWVLYSERPLRAEELCHALAVETESLDLDPENIPVLRTLLSSCLGLVTVEASSSTVRLVHFTLHEHLLSNPTLFRGPHSTIAEVCLTYLNFGCVRDLAPTLYRAPSTMPLLEYASLYWGKHARIGMTENVKILALKLLGGFDEHVSAQLLLLGHNEDRENDWDPYFDSMEGPTGFTALHAASFLGIVEIVAIVLENKEWDANATDCLDSTALQWAARNGHEEVVKMLLEREEINPDQADTEYGRTPISYAAEKGHSGIVKMLLEREEVNPDRADTYYGQTPISWAAWSGHSGIVKMLLEPEGVNPGQPDTAYGQTPLLLAAAGGHEGVVKILLEREEVNPDQADISDRTPLSLAAAGGHEGVVKMLSEREEVNPGQADTRFGQTPISWAAWRGHSGIVKMLLEREEVNPNQTDTLYGQMPISRAAEEGHEEVVKMLLEREEVNPGQADTLHGRTPILLAAARGHEGVVKMLLQRAEVNPNLADLSGRTPISWATEKGHKGIVKMLLERKEVNPNQTDTDIRPTPPPLAAPPSNSAATIIPLKRKRQ